MTRRSPAPPADVPRVGEYTLLARIGEGGMGVVHLAQRPGGQRVALKVLRPHVVGDEEARRRLAREVASLRRVTSPRVAEVVDADPWGSTPYVATRYVPGLSLHEHVRQEGPLPGEDLRAFTQGLAEALVAVHSVGVLHRDIKPSNVLLEGRAPVLIDFGLARLVDDPRLTHTGWLLGTPGYLAPEILYGDEPTVASDVHSWAASVAFAATGHPPYGRGPAVAVMDRVRRGEHDLSGVPEPLLPLLRECLAPERADRPDPAAVLNALRRGPGPHTPPPPDQMTLPYALVGRGDGDATEVLGHGATGGVTAPPATRRSTEHAPVPAAADVVAAAGPETAPGAPGRARGPARLQRGLLLLGLLAVVSAGVALAPYLSVPVLGVAVLAVRTVSRTTDAARERRFRRGRARWYDRPLAVATSPWHLLVASGGTVLLLVVAVGVALTVGLAYLVLAQPRPPALLVLGVVVGLCLWWGPGSRRLRVPVRHLVAGTTRWGWPAWLCLVVLVVTALLGVVAVLAGATGWTPASGPPWRPGSLLSGLVNVL